MRQARLWWAVGGLRGLTGRAFGPRHARSIPEREVTETSDLRREKD